MNMVLGWRIKNGVCLLWICPLCSLDPAHSCRISEPSPQHLAHSAVPLTCCQTLCCLIYCTCCIFDSPASTRYPADSRTCCLTHRLDLEAAIVHTSKVSSHSTHDHQLSNTGGIPSVQCLSTINLGIPFWAISELCLPQWHENETCVKMRFKLLIGSTCSMMFL